MVDRASFIRGPRQGRQIRKGQTIRERTARAAAQQGRWHAVLGLRPGASADEVRKARRRLQLSAHTDKGGSAELSQLINQAADKLLERCPEVREQLRRARE